MRRNAESALHDSLNDWKACYFSHTHPFSQALFNFVTESEQPHASQYASTFRPARFAAEPESRRMPVLKSINQFAGPGIEIPDPLRRWRLIQCTAIVLRHGRHPVQRVVAFRELHAKSFPMRQHLQQLRANRRRLGLHHRFLHIPLRPAQRADQQQRQDTDHNNHHGKLVIAPHRRYRLIATLPRSHIGKKMPRARIRTSTPSETIRIGSICWPSVFNSYSTSRWYIWPTSSSISSSAPDSSPTAIICSTTGVKNPEAMAERTTLSPRSTVSRMPSILAAI